MTSRSALSISACFISLTLVACYTTVSRGSAERAGCLEPVSGSQPQPEGSSTAVSTRRFYPSLRPESDYGAFPREVQLDGERLVLNGSGLCEWGFLGIDLYRAALYVSQPCVSLDDVLTNSSRTAFHLHFVRSLTREQLVEAYSASVRANAGEEFPHYERSLGQLCDALPTVQAGDSLTFVVDPRSRVEVFANERSCAVIEHADFARLFIILYLGEQPPTEALKRALLGAV